MKTLVIVSHPNVQGSNSQQFLKESLPVSEDITYHHLETTYPDENINRQAEQALLVAHDRIIFQFPLYWYSSPPLLKKWQDEVLTEGFAYGVGGQALVGKELGLVLTVGIAEQAYQAGGTEQFALSQLLIPYQAVVNKVGMRFLAPFAIHQFQYMTEREQQALLIRYQQYMTLPDLSLSARVNWFIEQLEAEADSFEMDQVIDVIEDLQLEIDEMRLHLNYGGRR